MTNSVRSRLLLAVGFLALLSTAPRVEARAVPQVTPARQAADQDAVGQAVDLDVDDASAPERDTGRTGRIHALDPEEAALEEQTRAVASKLRCPVCQGLSIEDSPTDLARDMRSVVKEQLASGRSREEVEEYFVSKYGEWILLEPKARGLNLAVYLLPVFGVLVGAGVVVRSARRWTRRAPRDESAT